MRSFVGCDRSELYSRCVIPIAFVVGLAVGRWWVMLIAATGWSVALIATGATGLEGAVLGGAALAAANTAWVLQSISASRRRFGSPKVALLH